MEAYICVTCGTQFAESSEPPGHCPVCDDERQYVGPAGQRWTTMGELGAAHRLEIRKLEEGLHGIGVVPSFAIGQRALLLQTPGGNLLWDCVSLADEPAVEAVRALGGISAIALSHPHFYAAMVEWSRAFGGAPIYVHEADARWVMRADPAVVLWRGESLGLAGGVTLIRCGGHFDGSAVLHSDRGMLLTGDTITVVADRRHVSFMRSYPNLIPLSPADIRAIVARVRPYRFSRIYGGWWDRVIPEGALAALERSAERYIAAIGGGPPSLPAEPL